MKDEYNKMKKLLIPVILGIFFSGSLAVAESIDLEGRILLFDTSGNKGKKAKIVSMDQGRKISLGFPSPEKTDLTDTLFALHVKGIDPQLKPLVFLDGKSVDSSPVRRKDGLLYGLPCLAPEITRHTLEIKSPDDKPLSFESLDAFSLSGSFEEIHFDIAFSDVRIASQPPKHPSQDGYDALHYDLTLELDMFSTNLDNASLVFTGRATQDNLQLAALDFHPNGGAMTIKSIQDDSGTPLSYSIDSFSNWLLITLPEALSTSETFTFTIDYSGRPSTAGVWGAPYRSESHDGSRVIYTFSQPYGARHWWPCKDIPEDKATIDTHITVEDGYFVVTNGKLLSIEEAGEGKRTFHYSETYPIVTYLVSICCSNYKYVSGVYTSKDGATTMSVGHYVYPENYEAEKNGLIGTLEAMHLFVDLFGEYPFLREKYVTATHNTSSGMEHQTCTSMPERNLSPDGRHRRNVHELCHQWFGDSITMEHYDHLWLNEGFATYSEALYYEYYQGEGAFHNYVDNWVSTGISDTIPLVSSSADQFYGSVVYRKGAWVLHMLRHVMGNDRFFPALRNYYAKYAYTTALTDDLQKECEALYGESLDWFFQEWVYGTGRPTYSWNWTVEETDGSSVIKLNITQTHSGGLFTMPVDVKISDINGNSSTYVVWNDQKNQDFEIDIGDFEAFDLEIDPDNWILNRFSTASAPAPTLESVKLGSDDKTALVSWVSGGGATGGFQIIVTDDLSTWTLASKSVIDPATRSFTMKNLIPGKDYYFRIRSLSTTGQPSIMSDTYGLRTGSGKKVLIVDGYDRQAREDGVNHPWAAWHGRAVSSCGISFDTCTNEALQAGTFAPSDYDALVWVLSEESTVDDTFNSVESGIVEDYLDGGGRLFVSGAEIGWDLDYKNNGRSFYSNYLKSRYERDDSYGIYTLEGTAGGIFDGMNFSFDDGSAGIYFPQYPDVIRTNGGSSACLKYGGTYVAGIQFAGLFPEGTSGGRLVYLAFPFETIYPESTRNRVMCRVLDFFGFEAKKSGYFFY